MGKVPVALVKTWGAEDSGFVASVTLSLPAQTSQTATIDDSGSSEAEAWVTQMQMLKPVPSAFSARCDSACTVQRLLEAVQEAMNRGPTGTETATEWNDDSPLAMLLQNNPYEEEMTERVRKALEEGATVTVERAHDEDGKTDKGKKLAKGKWTLNVTCKNKVGTTTKTTTKSCWWGASNDDPKLSVQGASAAGVPLELDKQVSSVLSDGAIFQVEATFKKRPKSEVGGCSIA